jgi:hypothetical protein
MPRALSVSWLPTRVPAWGLGSGFYATRRLGSALGGVSASHLHVGWETALLCLGSALPRWLVRVFALFFFFFFITLGLELSDTKVYEP